MKKKDKKCVDSIINICIFILTIVAVVWMYFFGIEADLNASRNVIFKFFTVDSNILVGIVGLLIFLSRLFNKRKYELNKIIYYLKYISVVSTTLTFLTVIFVLLPLGFSPKALFLGPNFIMHIVNPVLAFISFVYFESCKDVYDYSYIHGLVPSVIYSAVLLPLIMQRKVDAPYPFMDVEKNGVIVTAIVVLAAILIIFAISYFIDKLNKNVNK